MHIPVYDAHTNKCNKVLMNTYTHKHTQIHTHANTHNMCTQHAHTYNLYYTHAHTHIIHTIIHPHTFTLCTHTCAHIHTHTTHSHVHKHIHTYHTLTCTQTLAHTQHAHMQADTGTCKYTHTNAFLALSSNMSPVHFYCPFSSLSSSCACIAELFENYSPVKSKSNTTTRHVYYIYHTVRPINLEAGWLYELFLFLSLVVVW